MKTTKLDTSHLKTIKNYALKERVTPAYIYKLNKMEKMEIVTIDGVKFVDIEAYPQLPTRDK